MVRRVGRIVIAAAAIGAAVLVGNAAVSVFHTAALRNESAAVLHSNELLLALDNVLSLVKDAESGQRGYVITGRPEYLAPYRAAVASIQAQMDALERLAREDPVQQRLMADVRRRVGAKLGELELTIGLRDRKGFDLTRDVIAARRRPRRDGGVARDRRRDGRARGAAAGRAPGRRRRDLPGGAVQRGAGRAGGARGADRAFDRAVALPARPRRGRSADRRARRASARDAREHRRRGDHDRPGRPCQQPQPRRRVAHRLACRGSAGAAAGGGLSDRQRSDARAGREPGDPLASRRRDRRAGESHLADPAGRLGNADRRQRGADPRPAGAGARLHPRLSRHQRQEGG